MDDWELVAAKQIFLLLHRALVWTHETKSVPFHKTLIILPLINILLNIYDIDREEKTVAVI